MSRVEEIREYTRLLSPQVNATVPVGDLRYLLAELDRCRKVAEAAKACVAEWNKQLDRNPFGNRALAQEWWHLGAPHAAKLMEAVDEYEKGGGR